MKYTEEIVMKAASDSYKNGDVKFDINSNRCALLVIDMQDEYA